MTSYNISFGKSSENSACSFLKKQGYKILEKNYKTNYGEIDVIAKDGKTVCFIEIKSRSSCNFGWPEEAVSRIKQRKIMRSATFYLKSKNLIDTSARFDVLGMLLDDSKLKQQFKLIKDAFSLEEDFIC